jgi:hypothetical protein
MSSRRQAEPDYYAILGVPEDATPAEIERAYRDLASRRLNAQWRPGKAARELALINAAYGVLGYPDRRADYDQRRAGALALVDEPGDWDDEPLPTDVIQPTYRQQARRSLPSVQLGRPAGSSPVDAVVILLVVLLGLFIGAQLMTQSIVDLSFAQDFGERLGIVRPRRPAATASPAPTTAVPTVAPLAAPSPSAAPAAVAAPPGALPTAVAGQRFAGSEVMLSSPNPARRSVLDVQVKLMREGQPVPDANVYLVAHYLTVEERHPAGNATVKTDPNGVASISFNIGDATANYPVKLDVTALVEGQQVVLQSTFTPR